MCSRREGGVCLLLGNLGIEWLVLVCGIGMQGSWCDGMGAHWCGMVMVLQKVHVGVEGANNMFSLMQLLWTFVSERSL